jgi:hypothetical protein
MTDGGEKRHFAYQNAPCGPIWRKLTTHIAALEDTILCGRNGTLQKGDTFTTLPFEPFEEYSSPVEYDENSHYASHSDGEVLGRILIISLAQNLARSNCFGFRLSR